MSAYYHLIYLVFLTILSLAVLPQYNVYKQGRMDTDIDKSKYWNSIGLCAVLILFIGFRDPNSPFFGDSQAYSRFYNGQFEEEFIFDIDIRNPLFLGVFNLFSSVGLPVSAFFLFIALIYFGGICFACIKLFPRDALSSFLVYLVAFSTYTFSINGIKAGAAASLFLVALSLDDNKVKLWPWVFLALSIGFHHSMRVPVVSYIFCKFVKNPKFYTAFWISCFVIAALHITYFQHLFGSIGDEKALAYLGTDDSAGIAEVAAGFRIDFVLYSVMPILVGWYGLYKRNIKSESFEFLLNLYTFINAIWLLCIYASFTNRIAYLSWLMYPIVLIYPLLRENWSPQQYRSYKTIAMLHLSFTLFMYFIYY